MKTRPRTMFCFLAILLSLAACAQALPARGAQPTPSATAMIKEPTIEVFPGYPAGGKPLMGTKEAFSPFFEGASLAISKTEPGQAVLVVAGDLPTPCHTLTFKVALPDSANQIKVSLAILPPRTGSYCDQTITPIHQEIPLRIQVAGTYTVFMNGQKVGSITVP